ncbi:P22 phage major capsid protein family protein [Streptacidiphilus carbonis]|uniref:P22 phage major capsid protein family protein n=1 Tax=Streptacidiphilus carbonis TaxID=105422 RepID=UPI0005AA6A58|nr:P22 phage major capsid protein family protein [Streptacidiphilus carbonis]
MSFVNFIPAIWSKVILAALQKKLVYGSPMVVNSDYEGEISGPGNTVHITQFGDPTVSDYKPGGTITYEQLSDAGLTLLIDQAKSFSFAIDDVDRRQAAGDMQAYLESRAAYRLADAADQYIASKYTQVAAGNVLGSTGAPLTPLPYAIGGSSTWHPADFYTQVTEPLKVILDQNNVPDDDRYLIVPPWAESLLSQTQAFVSVTDMQGQPSETFQRGFMGQVSNFNVLKSNNAPQPVAGGAGTGVWAIQAGHPMGITYGEQITETEALRLQTTIADGVRGLHVYGAKMVRPDATAVAYVQRPTGI